MPAKLSCLAIENIPKDSAPIEAKEIANRALLRR